MLKAYKYRIYPTKEQEEFFARTFGCCRFVWNRMLEENLEVLRQGKKIPRITPAKYKKEYSFLKEVDSLALANVQLQQEKAFRDYFSNPKHFRLPKFKKKKDKQSYTTNNQRLKNGKESVKIDFENGLIFLPKLKSGIRAVFHRRFEGRIKSVTITKSKAGRYYVSVLVDAEEPRNRAREANNLVCGIDLGLKHFATVVNDSGVFKIGYPKYLIKAEKRLKRLQKALSRKQKNSKNYEKARIKLAKKHEYVKNAREDFLHKLSKTIIDDNQVVVVESLNVKGLIRTRLAKHIADSSWSKFLEYLNYKAKWYGREIIFANRTFPSSQICSNCGYKNEAVRSLKIREWNCPMCGAVHDRDVNSGANLRNYGIAHLMSSRVGTTRT